MTRRARVGVVFIRVGIPGAASLKEKRGRLRSLVDGLRSRFKVSVAEVGGQRSYDYAIIAAAVVGSDVKVVNGLLNAIANAAERYDVRVDGIETEVL